MSRRGFTLLELATVVGILSLLAAITVGSYNAYLRQAHTQVVEPQLRTLGALLNGRANGPIAAAPSPPAVPAGRDAPWLPSPGFQSLGFTPGPSTRFQYEVEVPGPGGAAWRALARGDLDGDGRPSLFELRADSPDLRVVDGLE